MNRVLIIGLGNPGTPYAHSRHNTGWLFLDFLVERWHGQHELLWRFDKKLNAEVLRLNHGNNEYILIKPQTFMNASGESVAAAAKWFLNLDPTEPDQEYREIIVAFDDLDIAAGEYKLQFGSGPQVHNGLNSVRTQLHSKQFWSARLGIDGRAGDRTIAGEAYVLQSFAPTERAAVHSAFAFCAEEISYLV